MYRNARTSKLAAGRIAVLEAPRRVLGVAAGTVDPRKLAPFFDACEYLVATRRLEERWEEFGDIDLPYDSEEDPRSINWRCREIVHRMFAKFEGRDLDEYDPDDHQPGMTHFALCERSTEQIRIAIDVVGGTLKRLPATLNDDAAHTLPPHVQSVVPCILVSWSSSPEALDKWEKVPRDFESENTQIPEC